MLSYYLKGIKERTSPILSQLTKIMNFQIEVNWSFSYKQTKLLDLSLSHWPGDRCSIVHILTCNVNILFLSIYSISQSGIKNCLNCLVCCENHVHLDVLEITSSTQKVKILPTVIIILHLITDQWHKIGFKKLIK